MPSSSRWGITPREAVERECARRGRGAVIDGCLALARGDQSDGELIHALGGPSGRWAVEGGVGGPDYWTRVWAARALLYVWEDRAAPTIVELLDDEAWRVREMAIRVCARHRVEDALPALVRIEHSDGTSRVRRAAERAVIRITAG